MNGKHKITSSHRYKTTVYLWQSSMAQAREHTESTGSQYVWRRQLLRELTGAGSGGLKLTGEGGLLDEDAYMDEDVGGDEDVLGEAGADAVGVGDADVHEAEVGPRRSMGIGSETRPSTWSATAIYAGA